MLRLLLVIIVVILALTSWAFIRNIIVYKGDLFGNFHITTDGTTFGQESVKPGNRGTLQKEGGSFWEFFRDTDWWKQSLVSFVGNFSWMSAPVKEWVYIFFLIVLMVLTMSGTVELIIKSRRKRKWALWTMLLLFECLFPVFLSYYYSYFHDRQPQGRYWFSAVPAVSAVCGFGYEFLRKHRKIRNAVFISAIIGASLNAFVTTYLPC